MNKMCIRDRRYIKEGFMNKKVIIGGLAVVVLLGIGGYSIVKKNKKKEANNIKIEQQKEVESLNKNELNNSIKGLSDQELIKKYLLLKDSKVPVKDRVEASEVARKFVKAITEYSSDDPNKGEKEALSCVSEEIYKDIQGMFITKESDNTIENIVAVSYTHLLFK